MLVSPQAQPKFRPLNFVELDFPNSTRIIVQMSTDAQSCIMSYAEDSIKLMCLADELNPVDLGSKSQLYKKYPTIFKAIIDDIHLKLSKNTKDFPSFDDSLFQIRTLVELVRIQNEEHLSDQEVVDQKYLIKAYECARQQEQFVNDVYYDFAKFLFPVPPEVNAINRH